jgi:sterol 3beta-glucosyltransferase
MRVLIVTAGSLGDVAPYVGLAARLNASGYEAEIATHDRFAPLVHRCGVGFRLLETDLSAAMAMVDDDRAETFQPGLQALVPNVKLAASLTRRFAHDIATAIQAGPVDVLLVTSTVAPLAWHVAEAMDLESVGVFLQPQHPSGDFPPVFLTAASALGPWANRAEQRMAATVINAWIATPTKELRTQLGLKPLSPWAMHRRLEAECWPVCYGFSPEILPRPADWRPGLHVVGYWWPPRLDEWEPPSELVDFLDAGSPPVFVSFGSMARGHGERLSELTRAALRRAGVRGVIQAGWAGLTAIDDDAITVDQVAYDWLMPRTAAVVHHAGAGTTGATLRAGVPVVPIPVGFDNPLWAERLVAVGVSPARLAFKGLSADDLAAAIRSAVSDPSYRRRAQEIARRIDAEDGAGRVADIVGRCIETVGVRVR